MRKIKAILSKAETDGLVERSQFAKYFAPSYIQEVPVFLTEKEIEAFKKVVLSAGDGPIKTSGYYFLLSCYTGYRISDLYKFRYDEMVKDRVITLRAKKNGTIVSIPIYPKLGEVLKFCQKTTLAGIYEQDMREHVKSIAKTAGIKQNVKVHSGRHSFAMLMLEKGLTINEISELLGDSKDVAKVYARILNKQLHRRVMEVMK